MAHEQVEQKHFALAQIRERETQLVRAVTWADFLSLSANINQEEILCLFDFFSIWCHQFKETLTFKSAQLKCLAKFSFQFYNISSLSWEKMFLSKMFHWFLKHCWIWVPWKCIFHIIHLVFQSLWTLNHDFSDIPAGRMFCCVKG